MTKTGIFLILIIFFTACNSKEKKHAAEKEAYQQAQETLLEKEKKNATAFLKISSNHKHNLIGQTVIKGSITNGAKVCIYYDVQIELSFISKTGALLEKNTETIYETIEPGKLTDFKTKYFAPKGTDTVLIKILSAKTK